jgi:hypothetical protein
MKGAVVARTWRGVVKVSTEHQNATPKTERGTLRERRERAGGFEGGCLGHHAGHRAAECCVEAWGESRRELERSRL